MLVADCRRRDHPEKIASYGRVMNYGRGQAMHDRTTMIADDQPWQALLDSAGEGIWGVDLDGNCSFVNRAALSMLGYEAHELVGRNMHAMVHHHYPDGRVYPSTECCIYNVFREGRPFSNQVDHVFRKDGSFFYAEMSAQPILQDGRARGAVVTFRDVTQTRLSEEALRRSEKLAAVGQLASSIAHEINNPLEAVINLLYLVRTAETTDDMRTYASLAEQEIARISDITMQTLRFHRQQTAAAPVDLHETIPAILRLYTSRFASRKVEVKLRLRQTPSAMLLEGDLRQVLNNLIRNAYDAMPKGGKLHVRLRPARCPITEIPGTRITVADTGTGFLPKMKKHLFEPFHTSKEITGTGLGLWISKGIIDKHGGRISMRSRLQELSPHFHGTLFSLWLPLDLATPAGSQIAPPLA
jgi:PAS domain S-box-containing protein